VNVFKTHADYIEPFERLIAELPEDGLLVACADDKTIEERMHSWKKKCVTYGFSQDALWRAENISWGHTTTFDLVRNGVITTSLATTLLGKHNVQNILGVSAFLLEKGYITPEELKEKIAIFEGIVRRLDRKSHTTSLPVYEGFGSSYDKARSAIEAIKLHFPNRRLVIVFEPHTFSWRNRQAIAWYDTVFSGATKVFIYKPPEHGSETHEQLSLEEIVSRVCGAQVDAIGFETVSHGKSLILDTLESTDVVLILSSGGMDGLMQELVSHIEQKFPLR
jgi:UDP-N-acetylmuramate: L-alanyl-gamma-D-glutamyl-meso-diaminopimelate ligase